MSHDIAAVAAKHGLSLVLQYGSSVTGRLHPHSDVDVAVQLDDPDLSLDRYRELLRDLQHVFPDREVDLAVLNRADPLFLKKILEACQVLFDREGRFAELKISAFKRYQDHRRFLDMERRYAKEFLARTGRPA